MKIKVLLENTVSTKAPPGLTGQHGLSFLLEIPGSGQILFDTGQTEVFANNLLLMDVMPDAIDYIVLSHGHFDHCGGLHALLRLRRLPVTIFAGPGLFATRYSQSGAMYRYIGVPFTKELLSSYGAEFIFTYGPSQMSENIWVSGPIPKVTEYEGDTLSLLDAAKQPDRFTDEVAVYLVQPSGLTVISGCAHRGLINAIKYGQQVTGVEKIHAVVGGSHLESASPWQIEETVKALYELQPDILALNHCTGMRLQARLEGKFGSRFIPANGGCVIEL